MENALPRTWSLCMTSENHGTVGPAGCTFSHAPEKHERGLVVEVPAAAGAPVDQVNLQLVGARRRRPVAEFKGYVDGQPAVTWLDRDNMPRVGTKLFDAPVAVQAGQVAAPERFVVMPHRLTADNGAKSLFIGEFSEQITVECPECNGDDECDECGGEGRVSQDVAISWDTIKRIYKMAVEHLAAPAQAAPLLVAPTCSCPSGSGSLRWPCDVHPPAALASTSGERQEGGAA